MKSKSILLLALTAVFGGLTAFAEPVAQIGDTTYETLEEAFDAAGTMSNPVVNLLADTTIGGTVVLTNSLTLTGPAVVTATSDGKFQLRKQATIVFENLTLKRDSSGGSFFALYEGSTLELGGGAVIDGVQLKVAADPDRSSVIQVTNGRLVMKDGSSVKNAVGVNLASGGTPVYLDGANSRFDFEGGTISKCSVGAAGKPERVAGVYVGRGAAMTVSGTATVWDNVRSEKRSDIWLASGGTLTVAGKLTGKLGLVNPAAEGPFAALASGVKAEDVVDAFVCEGDATLTAVADGASLVWTSVDPELLPVDETDPLAVVKITDARGTTCYKTVAAAFDLAEGAARVTLLQDAKLTRNLVTTGDVVFDGAGHTLTRDDTVGIMVTNHTLTVTNAVLAGGTARFIDVWGGKLMLEAGTVVRDVAIDGTGLDKVAPIVVWGGTFTMNPGVKILDCSNEYQRQVGDALAAGGVVVTSYKDAAGNIVEAKAVLNGGTVTGCRGSGAGGVYIGNKATVSVQGDLSVAGNVDLQDKPSNLVVHDLSGLKLTGAVTHGEKTIGFTEGILANTNQFGTVTASLSNSALVASARNFVHDTNGDIGAVVRGNGETLLVWSSAVSPEGTYESEEGKVYTVVTGGADMPVAVPVAVAGLVYTGDEQTGVPEGLPYEVTGNTATKAGSYTATVRLRPGYVWDDGTKTAKTVEWTIAKATYDMSGVTFPDDTRPYNAAFVRSLEIKGTLPAGVTVSYAGNGQTDPGAYTVTASFTGDVENYEPIPDMTATLTITGSKETPVECQPFAFTAIVEQADGSWLLTLAPGTEYCIYTLQTSDDLATWTAVGEPLTLTPGTDFEFTVPGGEAKRFWKVIGEDGVMPAGN